MLYLCIPVYNEAPTIGVLLWRIRKVLQEFPREYEVLVYDDGSTDGTREALEPYERVLPLTLMGGRVHVGYAAALEALIREVSSRTRYPRRDGLLTLQGDFTDQPEFIPELVKRFEGGADLVVGERTPTSGTPTPVRRLRLLAPWVMRPFVAVPGVVDAFSGFRLYRISVLRDLLKEAGDTPLLHGEGWAANAELLVRAARHARRIETAPISPRYDVRPRETRVRAWSDAMAILRTARALRASGGQRGASRHTPSRGASRPVPREIPPAPPAEPTPLSLSPSEETSATARTESKRRRRRSGSKRPQAERPQAERPQGEQPSPERPKGERSSTPKRDRPPRAESREPTAGPGEPRTEGPQQESAGEPSSARRKRRSRRGRSRRGRAENGQPAAPAAESPSEPAS